MIKKKIVLLISVFAVYFTICSGFSSAVLIAGGDKRELSQYLIMSCLKAWMESPFEAL
jgi:hypothetical protein